MAEKSPDWNYTAGEVRLHDLPIAAGLLGLNGAAHDGAGQWYYPGEDRAAWSEFVGRNGVRLIKTQLVGSHAEPVKSIVKAEWTDETGKRYRPGDIAPIPKVWFHVEGFYGTQTPAGAKTWTPWSEAEARQWLLRWHRPSNAFLVIPAVFNDQVNKLRNHIRDNYGALSRKRRMVSPMRGAI